MIKIKIKIIVRIKSIFFALGAYFKVIDKDKAVPVDAIIFNRYKIILENGKIRLNGKFKDL